MTDDRPPLDPFALAAAVRRWAIAFALWLAELFGDGAMTRSLRRWAHAELSFAERGAATLAVMAALRLLPAPVDPPARIHAHPGGASRGFARVAVRGNDLRRMTRHLFARERDLLARARRLDDLLHTLAVHAQRLARRIARFRPFTRMAMIAAVAEMCAAPCFDGVTVDDSS